MINPLYEDIEQFRLRARDRMAYYLTGEHMLLYLMGLHLEGPSRPRNFAEIRTQELARRIRAIGRCAHFEAFIHTPELIDVVTAPDRPWPKISEKIFHQSEAPVRVQYLFEFESRQCP